MTSREASHAGSWYTDDGHTLANQLQDWLNAVPGSIGDNGPAAAYAYKSLDLSKWYPSQPPNPSLPPHPSKHLTYNSKRIFLLGPSHHLYLPTCALPLPSIKTYSTPLGPLHLDTPTISNLRNTNEFSVLPLAADEAEHSLEMHLPYIRRLLSLNFPSEKDHPLLVPILVGSTSPASEKVFGRLLAPWLAHEENVFIISSDFCHWGLRFHYTYYIPSSSSTPKGCSLPKGVKLANRADKAPPKDPPIYESIAMVDRACMDAIETGEHEGFLKVLRETENTVCGRHPIGVVMAGMEVVREGRGEGDGKKGKGRFRFVRYERSSDVRGVGDSSVSYASAFAVF
ncbi:MAG: hypothetical protein Q9166_006479 [cf. Caloplaca sp. 2 TL-2023]